MSSIVSTLRWLLVVGLIAFPFAPSGHAQSAGPAWYTVTDLNPDALSWAPTAVRINNSGEIAGHILNSRYYPGLGTSQAAVYRNGAWVLYSDLEDPNPEDSFVPSSLLFGINDLGQAVGFMSTIINGTHPYDSLNQGVIASREATALSELPIQADVIAEAINNAGRIVGRRNAYLDPSPDFTRAFAYDRSEDSVIDLDLLLPGPREDSAASDVNGAGDVIGWVYLIRPNNNGYRGFFYLEDTSEMVLLESGGSHVTNARSINDRRQIVGEGKVVGLGDYQAVVFDAADGSITGLPMPAGTVISRAWDINNHGDIVGTMYSSASGERGFLYRKGQLTDLNDLVAPDSGWRIREARGINDKGQIMAFRHNPSAVYPAPQFGWVLLNPSAQGLVADLIEQIQALEEAAVLNGGNANALITKLEGSLAKIDAGHVGPAVNQLEAFINQVQALVNAGTLTAAQGQPLIDAANAIIGALTS